MNSQPCTVETCLATPAIASPAPLCLRHALEIALAVLPLALADALADAKDTTDIEPMPYEPIVTTEIERAALSALRVTGTAITRRSIERTIRSLGGRCASERAQVLTIWARDGLDLALFADTNQP